MKFNIDDYKGKYVMHCKTEEEAKDFLFYLDSIGKKWCSGQSYLVRINWKMYKSDTVYYFNSGEYADVDFATQDKYTILEWSDFMNGKFTKTDLRTGDVVMQRDGTIQIANCELGMFITQNSWNNIDDLNSNLENKYCDDYDIVAVRRPKVKSDCRFDAFKWELGTLVYERKEVEEMTLAEVCKLLGKEIKIVK